MNAKQILVSIIFLTIASNSSYAMNHAMNNDKPCELTKHRQNGDWFHPSIKETSRENQREPWHRLSHYIAEPLCTISNIPFFLVAHVVKNSSPLSAAALNFAGSASALSHAIPYQFLNNIDQIGAWAATAAVAYDANLYTTDGLTAALHNQKKLFALAAVGAIKFTDMYVARSKQIVKNSGGLLSENCIIARKPAHVWIHVLWHLLAAWTAYALLTAS
jgi:hypothetical protein